MAITPFRLLSAAPSADGETWDITGQLHQDDWYEVAYGQNPVPFQQPRIGSGRDIPYPWRPGVDISAFTSPLLGFEMELDASQYPALISARGSTPINTADSTNAPRVPLQATTSSTGGSILPGTYLLTLSANATIGPVSEHFAVVVVPPGTSTNTITVSGVQWRAAATSIAAYAGPTSIAMVYQGLPGTTYAGSSADSFGNDTSFTFTSILPDGLGLPDASFDHFAVSQTQIVHGGCWGAAIGSVTPHAPTATLTFPGAAWTTNQWAGYSIALYYRPGSTAQRLLELPISSSTADSVNVPHLTGVQFIAGDVVVMRSFGDHVTANTIGDDGFISSFSPSGLTVNAEAGNLVQIISGTGAWSAAKTIASNTSTVLTILGTWDVMPDISSVFIIVAPSSQTSPTATVTNDGSVATYGLVATVPAATSIAQSMLIQIATASAAGNTWPMRYQPFRELYIPAQSAVGGGITINGVQVVY